ncbi:biotin/lipoyl-binding protein [Paenibacillus psychroresistens]|uniref:Biotin/lipoyl-binding protein n=2 Tax=Paenibacillus psychroresistens TaxID=1778678 RepID=A0A6B8RGD8_9BACL|nr:biotin/lipoyl-binding protein [Paenibacillus psychroresistens]
MRTFQYIFIAGLVFTLSGCALLPVEEEALKPPLVKPAKQSFEVVDVKVGSIAKQLKNGASFVSSKTQDLFFKHSGGRLQSIIVKSGDLVKQGEVIARLDPEDLENRITQQELMLERVTIFYKQAEQQNPNDAVSLRLKKIDIEVVQNELTQLNEQLEKTKLISTIDGIVTYVSDAKEGDYMGAYVTIISISDPKHIQLQSQFSSAGDLSSVTVGMKTEVIIAEKKYQGKVLQIPSSAPYTEDKDQQDKNSKILIVGVAGLPENITLGVSADIVLTLEQKKNALIIPRSALSTFLGRDFVHVLEGESRKEIDVEKGITSSTEVEITKGLKEGQKVIIK